MIERTRQRGKRHDDATRAAVIAALLAGQGVEEVAGQYNLPVATVSTWKATINPAEFDAIRNKKGERFGEMLADYLTETLTTLRAQAAFFRDEKWLQQQSAADVAVLHGVCADKAIRLLEAIERASAAGEAA